MQAFWHGFPSRNFEFCEGRPVTSDLDYAQLLVAAGKDSGPILEPEF